MFFRYRINLVSQLLLTLNIDFVIIIIHESIRNNCSFFLQSDTYPLLSLSVAISLQFWPLRFNE